MLVEFSLIQRAREGDNAAFNEMVHAYRKRILGTISRLIGRPEDVEDVGQEVFLRLYYSLDQLRSPEVFEPWLYRLTVNAAYDYMRKQKRRPESRMADLSEQQVLSADADAGGRARDEELQKTNIQDEFFEVEKVLEKQKIKKLTIFAYPHLIGLIKPRLAKCKTDKWRRKNLSQFSVHGNNQVIHKIKLCF